jgi:hypothetical protein
MDMDKVKAHMKKQATQTARVEIERADNGGYTVREFFKSKPSFGKVTGCSMNYVEPELTAFGDGQEEEMMAHVKNCLGMGGKREK